MWFKSKNYTSQPKSGLEFSTSARITFKFILLSVMIHTIILTILPQFTGSIDKFKSKKQARKPIKFSVEKVNKNDFNKKELKIVETIQEKTVTPPDPKTARLGYTDHKSIKETRVKAQNQAKGLDPKKATLSNSAKKSHKNSSPKKISQTPVKGNIKMDGAITIPSNGVRKSRNEYEKLLASSESMINSEHKESYKDLINEDIEEGDIIDLNTQEYRYIGYFTNLRKAIELTWNYPLSAARSGMYGNVFLKFTIDKTGSVTKISVINSSGHKVLDSAIVQAIELASPFAPLPKSFGRKIQIKGDFNYVLH